MPLQLNDIPTTVARSTAVAQAIVPALTDTDENSPFAALLYAAAYNNDYLQYLALAVLAEARLSTCVDDAVDTFVADFGLTRLPGINATGNVTFSRLTATNSTAIPPGTTIKTSDGTLTFSVVRNEAHENWNAGLDAYFIGANIMSISVPVECITTGVGGNIQAGTLTQLTTSIAGVDAVTNPLAFSNGVDTETDTALKIRFSKYIKSLSKATVDAIKYAIESTQQGLSYVVNENLNSNGITERGTVTVWVDDGSGSPSTELINRVYSAVDATRACAIHFTVRPATVVTANTSMVITALDGYSKPALVEPVKAAVSSYINSLKVGETLSYHRISQVAYDSVEGIARVDSVLLNGGTSNLNISSATGQVARAGTVTVS